MDFTDPEACAQAAIDAARATGKRRVLLSGSLSPQYLATITAMLAAENLVLNDPDPDPLGFEDLISQVSPDMVCVIFQNPGYFGTLRDLTGLISECREWDVPLFILNTAPPAMDTEHVEALANRIHRIPGMRVITDDLVDRFSVYLGEDQDSADVAEMLVSKGITCCEAVALTYPNYPELRPVLIVNGATQGEALVAALRQVLASRD